MECSESRAVFNNVKKNSAMNVLTQQDIKRLWHPLITYANTAQKEMTIIERHKEQSTAVKVKRESKLTRVGMESVDEVDPGLHQEVSLPIQIPFVLFRHTDMYNKNGRQRR